MSDSRPECAIQEFLLYGSPTQPLTDSSIRAQLNADSYTNNGNLVVNSDLSSNTAEYEFEFYIAARGALNEIVVSDKIRVIIGCYDVTTISGAYKPGNSFESTSGSVIVSALS